VPDFTGAPDTIRTCDLCLRRATLYPAELRVRESSFSRLAGPRQRAPVRDDGGGARPRRQGSHVRIVSGAPEKPVPSVPGLWRSKSSSQGGIWQLTVIRSPGDPGARIERMRDGHLMFKLLPLLGHSRYGGPKCNRRCPHCSGVVLDSDLFTWADGCWPVSPPIDRTNQGHPIRGGSFTLSTASCD
jgi:hypothetical protein